MTSRGFNGKKDGPCCRRSGATLGTDVASVSPVSTSSFVDSASCSDARFVILERFCGLKGHEMFCEVERSYIEDGFNLYGLRACVSNFSDCLDLILDRIGPDDSDDSHLTQSACTLYGLIHARYIITAHGLDAMYNKVRRAASWVLGCYQRQPRAQFISCDFQYAAKEFGACPLVQCSGQPVLPVGLKDEMGADTVKIFCPKCTQVYHTPPLRSRANISTGVDGAAFGTTFPHLFLMTFSNLVPDPLPVESSYVPRVFGFRVHLLAQRALPSPEASAPAAAAAAAADAAVTAARKANSTNANNNNNDANQRDLGDEDEKSAQGEDASTTNQPAAAAETVPANNDNNNAAPAAAAPAANTNANAAAGRSRAKGKRGRKEDKATAATTTTTTTATANASGTAVAPTFLMENPAKRRRRGAGNA